MKLPELWKEFEKGKWITRKEWKRNFAIQVCNIPTDDESWDKYPLLIHDTQGFLYKFGMVQTSRFAKRASKLKYPSGLQYDLFAEDWVLADQTACDMERAKHDNHS